MKTQRNPINFIAILILLLAFAEIAWYIIFIL